MVQSFINSAIFEGENVGNSSMWLEEMVKRKYFDRPLHALDIKAGEAYSVNQIPQLYFVTPEGKSSTFFFFDVQQSEESPT